MEWCSDSNEYKDFGVGLCCFVFVERNHFFAGVPGGQQKN